MTWELMAASPVAAGVAVGVAEEPKSGAAVAEGRNSLGMAVEAGDPQAAAAVPVVAEVTPVAAEPVVAEPVVVAVEPVTEEAEVDFDWE